MPKKLPKGISDYEKLVNEKCYYIDKTMYIEKLENMADYNIMLLRPRKFGKSLFVSTLNNYYDKNKKEQFEELFGETYIGKNPTRLKNGYCMLNFDFSGIDTSSAEETIKNFREKIAYSVINFTNKYGIEFYIEKDQSAEMILVNVFSAFGMQKQGEKIYVTIDEYDHFANELLGFNTRDFKDLISKNGKIRKWYEILKEGTKTVVDRIFITGVAPITLDSMTSGFNISKDLTRDERFNEIFGFTEDELIQMMKEQELAKKEIDTLLPIMRENYDGYKFSIGAETKMYNSNMCLNFLDDYIRLNKMPESMIDINIASDYKKLGNMLNLCQGEERETIIKESMAGEGIVSKITEKFNPEKEFDTIDLVSMLFYLGYLTIAGESFGEAELKVPNKIMRELYAEYFLERITEDEKLKIPTINYNAIKKEIALEGKIEKLINIAGEYLNNLSNRDYIKFDEKYIKLIIFCIAMNLKSAFWIKSEMEMQRKYPDLLIIPKEKDQGYFSIMIELKYLKKEDENKIKEKQEEAKAQILEYKSLEEIKNIEKIKSYSVVAVNNKLYVEEI